MKKYKFIVGLLSLNFVMGLFSNLVVAKEIQKSEINLTGTIDAVYDKSLSLNNSFFSLISRLRYIYRWSLLQNFEREDLEHHSFEVGMIAYTLAVITNIKFGGHLNAERAAVLGMFHDVTEIITGDMPSTIKYCGSGMKPLYTQIENQVSCEMLNLIDDDEIRQVYASLMTPTESDKELVELVKAADKISALIKCFREKKLGNKDFDKALEKISASVLSIKNDSVQYFIKNFLPAYGFDLYVTNKGNRQV